MCTRTCPPPSHAQIVLETRRRVLEAARPGETLSRLHTLSVRLLSEGLHQLRLLPGVSVEAIQAHHYRSVARAPPLPKNAARTCLP